MKHWDSLVNQKRFGPPLWFRTYNYETEKAYAYLKLLTLGRRRPEFVDRIVRILTQINERTTYDDVVGGLPGMISERFLKLNLDGVSSETLRGLLDSIPDEKEYVLAYYKFAGVIKVPFDVKKVYQLYESINRDNYVELLKDSFLVKYELISEPEDDNKGLGKCYQVRDRIEEQLEVRR